ncbi:hypothetical protein ACJX0J_015144, partial [Zea mays]
LCHEEILSKYSRFPVNFNIVFLRERRGNHHGHLHKMALADKKKNHVQIYHFLFKSSHHKILSLIMMNFLREWVNSVDAAVAHAYKQSAQYLNFDHNFWQPSGKSNLQGNFGTWHWRKIKVKNITSYQYIFGLVWTVASQKQVWLALEMNQLTETLLETRNTRMHADILLVKFWLVLLSNNWGFFLHILYFIYNKNIERARQTCARTVLGAARRGHFSWIDDWEGMKARPRRGQIFGLHAGDKGMFVLH